MQQAQLTSQVRIGTGKGVARQLRMKGLVPAVLYGGESGNLSLAVNSHDLRQVLAKFGENSLIDLTIQQNGDSQKASVIIKDLQIHPLKRSLVHCDFLEVTMGQTMEITVALQLTGEAPGVKAGGVVEFVTRELTVECLPSNFIHHIDVDISALEMGDTLTVGDLSAGEGRTITTDPDTVVVTITTPMSEEEAEEAEEEEDVLREPEVIHKGKKPEEEELEE